jgi:hypothetical protein
MVRAHLALRQQAGDPLGHPARVDKDQDRARRLDQPSLTIVDLLPDVAGHDGFERRGRNFEGEIARTLMLSMLVQPPAGAVSERASRNARNGFDRLLGRREAHPALPPPALLLRQPRMLKQCAAWVSLLAEHRLAGAVQVAQRRKSLARVAPHETRRAMRGRCLVRSSGKARSSVQI